MKAALIAVSLILLLLSPNLASATDLTGQSRSYLTYREGFDGTRYLPLYEYLDLQTTGIGNESVTFQFGGWYRYDLKNVDRDRTTGDLQYAYLDLHAKQANSSLRLGRVLVNEGVAAEQVDGAYARTDLRGGFTVAAFGGLPVETAGDTRSSDSVYGGRISQSVSGIYTLGVSYLKEKNDGKDFRKEEGVDLWLQPLRWVTVQGLSSYNALNSGPSVTADKGWMQHHYYLLLGPFGGLRLTGEYSKVYYGRYFRATNLSAFATPGIDPNETVTTAGGSAEYTIASSFTIGADYKTLDYKIANTTAQYYGGRLVYASSAFGGGLAAHRMDGPTDRLQYDDYRVYVTMKFSPLDITLDLYQVSYKQPINGVDNAYSGTAAAGINLSPAMRLVADVEYAKNPDFDKDVRGMLTFVWRFDTASAPAAKTKTRKASAAATPDLAAVSHSRTTGLAQETL